MKKIINILTGDLTIVRFFMAILSAILAIGFFVASTDNTNYKQIISLADKKIWGFIFLIHAISLFMTIVYHLPIYLKRFLNALGIWIWSYVFLSFTFYDPSPTAPIEWMLVMPVILEFLLLTERMSENKK